MEPIKNKKHKKKKEIRKARSESDSDDCEEWVEVTTPAVDAKPQRETWMEMASTFIPTISRKEIREKNEKKTLVVLDKPGQNERELNPYWKDGGSGLPTKEKQNAVETKVGDGGMGWLRKAHRRLREQAQEEGRTMEELAVERFGSLERLEKMLEKDRRDFRRPDEESIRKTSHNRRHSSQPRWKKPDAREPKGRTCPSTSATVEEKILTEKELNELAAKLVKAELMGNVELAINLQERLKVARSEAKREVVMLTQSNSKGMTRLLVDHQHDEVKSRKKLKIPTRGEKNYFDDKYSLQQMFEREKFTTADDDTALYLKMAAKGRTDGDYDFDDLYEDKLVAQESKSLDRNVQRAIREDKYTSATLEKCSRCLDSKMMQKHLIIAMGTKSYLALPSCQSLVEGHCIVVPMAHTASATLLDEDVWAEIQSFRKALHRLFLSRSFDCVFLETSMQLRRQPHTFVECIPLPMDDGALAPMYFKKAILESETEWAQNKKLVDLSKKDVRHSVPKGLPYFSVDFGLEGGFAHVIEDEQLFPKYFGTEIIGGILDLEPQLWMKPKRQKFEEQSKKVLQFTQWWKPFDFTQQ